MARESLTTRAYRHIREAVLTGSLRAGAVISEAKVARTLGVSRTPVGEAIRQLAEEGLLEQLPRVGTIVRGITREDLVHIHEIREALEPYAAAKAATCISSDALVQLERYCRAMSGGCEATEDAGRTVVEGDALRRCLAADLAFHLLIIEAIENTRMIRIFKEIDMPSRLFRVKRSHGLAAMKQAVEGHRRILDALHDRNETAAHDAMAAHLRQAHAELLETVEDSTTSTTGTILRELPADVLKEIHAIDAQDAEPERKADDVR